MAEYVDMTVSWRRRWQAIALMRVGHYHAFACVLVRKFTGLRALCVLARSRRPIISGFAS